MSLNYCNNSDSLPQEIPLYSDKYRLGGPVEFVRTYECDWHALLGSGGFGRVYPGVEKVEPKRNVVIKYVTMEKIKCWVQSTRDSIPELVPLEVELLARCQQAQGVVSLLGAYQLPTGWLIVMERLPECMDLFDFITHKRTLTEEEAAHFLLQLVRILQQCHAMGVLHRDIKDENIIVCTRDMSIRLIDFGGAAYLKSTAYQDFEGTKVYAPPEWLCHRWYEGKSAEVWSLGILLYDMVCGDVPLKLDHQLRNPSAYLRIPTVGLSLECQSLLASCLNVCPLQRIRLGEICEHDFMKKHIPAMLATWSAPVQVAVSSEDEVVPCQSSSTFTTPVSTPVASNILHTASLSTEVTCPPPFCQLNYSPVHPPSVPVVSTLTQVKAPITLFPPHHHTNTNVPPHSNHRSGYSASSGGSGKRSGEYLDRELSLL